jgi:hypothetical protein
MENKLVGGIAGLLGLAVAVKVAKTVLGDKIFDLGEKTKQKVSKVKRKGDIW